MASIPRYLGKMALPYLVGRGFKTPRIIQYFTRSTGTWRNTTMLRDIREAQDIYAFGGSVKELAVNIRPPKSIMSEVEWKRPRKYKLVARAKLVDIETGFVEYRRVSFFSNTWSTKEAWGDEFAQDMLDTQEYPDQRIVEVDIYSIQHKAGFAY